MRLTSGPNDIKLDKAEGRAFPDIRSTIRLLRLSITLQPFTDS